MPERPGGKPMPVGGSGANYSGGTHSRSYNPGAGGVVQHGGGNKQTRSTGNGTKGTISRGDVKDISLAGSVLTKNPVGAVVNLLSADLKERANLLQDIPKQLQNLELKDPLLLIEPEMAREAHKWLLQALKQLNLLNLKFHLINLITWVLIFKNLSIQQHIDLFQ